MKWEPSNLTTIESEWHDIAFNLGRVSLNWSYLEMQSAATLWVAADLRLREARILTNGQQIQTIWQQTELCLGVEDLASDLGNWFHEWQVRADTLRVRRNRAIHSQWLPTGNPSSPYEALEWLSRGTRVDAKSNVVPGASADLNDLATSIGLLGQELLTWGSSSLVPQMRLAHAVRLDYQEEQNSVKENVDGC